MCLNKREEQRRSIAPLVVCWVLKLRKSLWCCKEEGDECVMLIRSTAVSLVVGNWFFCNAWLCVFCLLSMRRSNSIWWLFKIHGANGGHPTFQNFTEQFNVVIFQNPWSQWRTSHLSKLHRAIQYGDFQNPWSEFKIKTTKIHGWTKLNIRLPKSMDGPNWISDVQNPWMDQIQ
jgi:hypothetical protein